MKKYLFAFLIFSGIFACQTIEDDSLSGIDRSVEPIVNGTRDPQAVPLSDSQIMAIGWLHPYGRPSGNFCTGTLVTPELVITAAHCTYGVSAGEISFGIGLDPANPEATFVSAGVYRHPAVDAAMILLDEDATAAGVDITPIPINQAAVSGSAIGRAVQAGGYGNTRDPDREGRWFATVYIDQVTYEDIYVDGRGKQGLCYGDSGSGLIDLDSEGNPVVLAVESGGDDSCVDIDYMTRLDTIYEAWITPILNGEYPVDPCEDLGREGRCADNVAEWCPRGLLRQADCTVLGTECIYVPEADRHGCSCDRIGDLGWCNGDIAEFCWEGRIVQMNCAMRGYDCGYVDEEAGYYCVENAVCRPEDQPGRCEDDTAISCSEGRTTREICHADDLVCVETEDGAECVDPDPGADGDADVDASGDAGPNPDAPENNGCDCHVVSGRQSSSGSLLTRLILLARGVFL